ncbi:hypothetical protein P7B02_04225 [Caulobacter segnis]|uniref:hypothetical protein n=1 Tax=Caulobacter segnis TaxID=88688 RepID=UPI00241034C1|nr:hypothetical protein [Caulobacter segnis]MDG2520740.1 hypothetical protein [Caulobacter segnis]
MNRVAAVAALAAVPALAFTAPSSAQAQGALGLTPGAYVQEGRDCAAGASFNYDGQTLTASGAKNAWRDSGDAWIRVTGADSFKLTQRKTHPAGKAAPALHAKTYRLCAA